MYICIYILYSVLFLGHCVFLVEAVHFNVIFDGLKLGLFWFWNSRCGRSGKCSSPSFWDRLISRKRHETTTCSFALGRLFKVRLKKLSLHEYTDVFHFFLNWLDRPCTFLASRFDWSKFCVSVNGHSLPETWPICLRSCSWKTWSA